ncbi:hypothetical protein EV667_2180 [Ancylobacter aquaticus]|uniref:Uncharacterized protein n=1 Tax=Ancylobacter aquaticus TaxID=100 RepID=A0A4R1ICB2_ANCAQ|nr:hypothetical protein [Ancylobacter aquaticus]TCK28182.1 hypothetical protein EV667_2180 [Ancylobacter aquaticus]
MTIEWDETLRARSTTVNPRGGWTSGGRSLSGAEQRTYSDAGYWSITCTVPIRKREQALAWRAMKARMGMAEPLRFKMCELWRPEGAADATVLLESAAAARTTQISLASSNDPALELRAGHYFSVSGERLHLITRVISHDEELQYWDEEDTWVDPSPWWEGVLITDAVAIFPPLRGALAGGTAVNFSDLVCLARPEEATSGDLDLDLGRFADVTLTLVEYL